MPDALPDQVLSECKVVIYMPQSLKDELVRRAKGSNSEGYSVSKLARTAFREYFKRHPA